jgi:hypothetical protein
MIALDFRDAAQQLGAQITTSDMAAALDAAPDSIRQARLVEGAPGYRRPPEGWQRVLAKLARRRAAELVKLAEQLERGQ